MNSQNLPKTPVSHEMNSVISGTKPQAVVKNELSDLQLKAVLLLAGGAKFTHVAEALGIDRRTLYQWRTEIPEFNHELGEFRKELEDFAKDRFRNIKWLALDRFESLIRDDYSPVSLKAAKAFLTLARLGDSIDNPQGRPRRNPTLESDLKETPRAA